MSADDARGGAAVLDAEVHTLVMGAEITCSHGVNCSDIPPYSSDMDSAWLVVEHVKASPFSVRHFFIEAMRDVMKVEDGTIVSPFWWVFFLTPERICRAALTAARAAGDAGR